MQGVRFLLLPGWQNSGPDHWQSHWQHRFGMARVDQDDWLWPRRGDWMARLQDQLLADERPAVLVAHSLGCHLAAAWAAHSPVTQRVAAALLVAPPDLQRADLPEPVRPWARPVRDAAPPLPFPSTLVFSRDDPYCSADRAEAMARLWGAEPHCLGAAGHVNAASGLADWPAGQALLRHLLTRAGLTAALPGQAPDATPDNP